MFVACKLPHGLQITHAGKVLRINGPNEGMDLSDPAKNGAERDTAKSYGGFGLTELKDDDAKAYQAWVAAVTFKDGDKSKGKHEEPFAALENGALLDFPSQAAARSEIDAIGKSVTSGFEGVDPSDKKNGVEKNTDAK
jgi:hypothetical protein